MQSTYRKQIDMRKEYWKKVPGLPNYYEVSNYGRARTTDHISIDGKTLYGHLLAQHETDDGYLAINHNTKGITTGVHNLVARAFFGIPKDKRLNQVNHIDENKHNNRADNLEWCTDLYNVIYGNRTKHQQQTLAKNGRINSKFLHGFYAIKLDTHEKHLFYTTPACANYLGLNKNPILDCLSSNRVHAKTYQGYTFVFVDDYCDDILKLINPVHKNGKPIRKLRAVNIKTGKVIVANSQKELAHLIGSSNGNISMVLNSPIHHTVKGYRVNYIN